MFNQARTNTIFNVVAAAVLDNDRFNALQVEKPCKHKPGRARTDDSDLSAHHRVLVRKARRIGARPRYGKGMKTGKPCTIAARSKSSPKPFCQRSIDGCRPLNRGQVPAIRHHDKTCLVDSCTDFPSKIRWRELIAITDKHDCRATAARKPRARIRPRHDRLLLTHERIRTCV